MDFKIKMVIGVLVVGLLIGGWWVWNNSFFNPAFCEKNEDCVLIGESCCSVKTMPVNKQHRPVCNVECAASSIGKATCEDNRCKVSEFSDILGGTSESKCKELGGFVTCDATPEGTDMSCLCCFKDYPNDCRFVK